MPKVKPPRKTLGYAGSSTPTRATPVWLQRRAVVLAAAVVVVGFVGFLAGSSIDIVLYRLLTDGVLVGVWLFAAGGIGGVLLSLIRTRDDRFSPASAPDPSPQPSPRSSGEREQNVGVLRLTTSIAIGLGVISLAMLALGLVGLLNRPVCCGLILVGLALAALKLRRGKNLSAPLSAWLREFAGWSWLWLLAAPFLGISLVAAIVPPGILWGDEPNGYDVLEYHLQIPREWYDAARITRLDHNVFSYFPQGVEMHDLLAMELRGGPWAGMYAAQLMQLAFVALSVAAVYGGARALSGGRGAATIAGVAAGTVPWMTLLAPIAYNEGGLLLYGTLAMAWAGRALRNGDNGRGWIRDVVLAAICAGFACGVKLTAVPVLVVAIPIAWLIAAPNLRRLPRIVMASAVFVAVAVLVFSPWMLRNVAWAKNPVFPEGQNLFGRGPFMEVQAERWKRAHSATPAQQGVAAHLAAMRDQILTDWRFGYVLLPLGVIALILAFRRPESRLFAALLIFSAIFWIGFTHLQGRFFVLAIPICALLIAQLDRPRWQTVTAILVSLQAVIALGLVLEKFAPMAEQFRAAGAFGVEDLSFAIPQDAQDLIKSNTPIDLAGDAKAFLYPVPSSRLRYRTVFDVNAQPNQSIVDAWLGGAPRPGAAVIVDPPELERFSRTYYGIPTLPADSPMAITRPFVIPPQQAATMFPASPSSQPAPR